VYDEAKRFSEALTTAYRSTHGVDAAIVRIFNTFGPRMRPEDGRAIPTFIRQALVGEPITVAGDGQQTRSVCFVDDLVAGILAMVRSDHPGPINIGNPTELTVQQIAEDVVATTGSRSVIRYVERPVDDPQVRRPDTTLAQQVLGWQPQVSWLDGLSRTVDWFARAQQRPA
jgi:dTDP-glucose 4,6-dehydratase